MNTHALNFLVYCHEAYSTQNAPGAITPVYRKLDAAGVEEILARLTEGMIDGHARCVREDWLKHAELGPGQHC